MSEDTTWVPPSNELSSGSKLKSVKCVDEDIDDVCDINEDVDEDND